MALHTERSLFCLCARSLSFPSFAANDVQGRRGERTGGGEDERQTEAITFDNHNGHTHKKKKKKRSWREREGTRGGGRITQGRTLTRQNRDEAPVIIHPPENVARAAVSLRPHRE